MCYILQYNSFVAQTCHCHTTKVHFEVCNRRIFGLPLKLGVCINTGSGFCGPRLGLPAATPAAAAEAAAVAIAEIEHAIDHK